MRTTEPQRHEEKSVGSGFLCAFVSGWFNCFGWLVSYYVRRFERMVLSAAVLAAIGSAARGAGTAAGAPVMLDAYTTAPAFGGVRFKEPVQVVFAPGEKHRAFVVERGGIIAIVRDL